MRSDINVKMEYSEVQITLKRNASSATAELAFRLSVICMQYQQCG